MKRLLLFCLLLFPAVGFTQTTDMLLSDLLKAPAPAKPDSCYMALWWKVLKGLEAPSSENMQKLYYGFAQLPCFQGDLHAAQYEINSLIEAGKSDQAGALAVRSLLFYPASPRLFHLAATLAPESILPAFTRVGYTRMSCMLLQTIRDSGDGSEEHPFRVIAITDEYDFLLRVVGTEQILRQSRMVNDFGVTCDLMEFEPPTDGTFPEGKIWFDITIPDKLINQQLSREKN